MNRDLEQLRLLSVFHYIVGTMLAMFSMFPVIHLVLGLLLLFGVLDNDMPDEEMGRVMGAIFAGVALTIITIGLTLSFCVMLAGRKLSRRTGYGFCFVVACFECTFMPFGTVLGVFTIIVLNRTSVRALFGIVENAADVQIDETGSD